MNAVERLEAAITKLETRRAFATGGAWRVVSGGPFTDGLAIAADGRELLDPGDFAASGATFANASDAELVVTLHRTIDAQLAILRDAYEQCATPFAGMYATPEPMIVALADAILGGDQ